MGNAVQCSHHKCCNQKAKQEVDMEMDAHAVDGEVCWDEVSNASSPTAELSSTGDEQQPQLADKTNAAPWMRAQLEEELSDVISDEDSSEPGPSTSSRWLTCSGDGATDSDSEIAKDTGYVGVHALKNAIRHVPPRDTSTDTSGYARHLLCENVNQHQRNRLMDTKPASTKSDGDRLMAMRRAISMSIEEV